MNHYGGPHNVERSSVDLWYNSFIMAGALK